MELDRDEKKDSSDYGFMDLDSVCVNPEQNQNLLQWEKSKFCWD